MAKKHDELKQRLAGVLKDLREEGGKDPEAMWLIGSLSMELMNKVKAKTWEEFKSSLSSTQYDRLLAEFQDTGNALYQTGDIKRAYAMQALGISIICTTQRNDPMLADGEKLLDAIIGGAIKMYKRVEKIQ